MQVSKVNIGYMKNNIRAYVGTFVLGLAPWYISHSHQRGACFCPSKFLGIKYFQHFQ